MARIKRLLQYQQREFSFLNKSALWLGNVALIFITPFAIKNYLDGHLNLSIATFGIMCAFAVNTITMVFRKKYYSNVSLFFLSPVIIVFAYFAIQVQGIIGMLWCFPVMVSLYYLLPERQAWFMNVVLLGVCAYMAFENFDERLALRIVATLSLISAFTAVSIRQINKQQLELHRLAITDPLTGLYNRNTLSYVLDHLINNHHKLSEPCHLMTLDVDYFKKVNDQHGHDQGDMALLKVAHCINNLVNDDGVVYRYGGEEFMVVLENMTWQDAKRLAEKIRLSVTDVELIRGYKTTISIGLSRLKPKMNRLEWIKESDRNLYLAKQEGRNQVVAS